jgi:hypothetical protein
MAVREQHLLLEGQVRRMDVSDAKRLLELDRNSEHRSLPGKIVGDDDPEPTSKNDIFLGEAASCEAALHPAR